MSFQRKLAKNSLLCKENSAWRLLRKENAPMIIAFITDLFVDKTQVSYNNAKNSLDTELLRVKDVGLWDGEVSASTYLNDWINAGLLRELDDQLTKTDACDIAINFCKSLEQRNSHTTASHLKIVQDSVRDLLVAINPDPEVRLNLLHQKLNTIQNEIDQINAGVIGELSSIEQSERIREIYQLASVLTGDFRKVEDEIRQYDQEVRKQMISDDATRGSVIEQLINRENLLASTEAGSAFTSFYQLLCDQNRTTEFREQLKDLLEQPISQHLTVEQKDFLNRLMRVLITESERVFDVRRRTEEGLKNYIESGAFNDSFQLDELINSLEQHALILGNFENTKLGAESGLSLNIGSPDIGSPVENKLKAPDEHFDTSGVSEHKNSRELSSSALDNLEQVSFSEVAINTRDLLTKYGPMSIAGICEHHAITKGLEELVAFIKVATTTNAPRLTDKEKVTIKDYQGNKLIASIPKYLLSSELFSKHIEELSL